MTTPEPGDFGVVATNGWGARLIRAVTRSSVNHAILYVGDGQVVEAQPDGARLSPVTNYPDARWSTGRLGTTPEQGALIAAVGRRLVGTRYSWVDDVCIGLAHLFRWHVPVWVRRLFDWTVDPVKRRLVRLDRLECAQLVDVAYASADVHLFADGRYPGDVAPSDLLDLIDPTNR